MILVTGATGLVGRELVTRLAAAGRPPLAVSRVAAVQPACSAIIDLAQPDLVLADAIPRPGAVVHLAAALPYALPDTDETAGLTRRMDQAVATAVSEWKCPAVYTSTCGLYDPSDPVPQREDSALPRPRSPYFAVKLAGECLFADCSATILRLAAPVGARLPRQLVLARFVAAALSGSQLPVWGSGSREQSFVDVRDISAAILKVLDDPAPGIFNLAGPTVTMLELAQVVVHTVRRGEVTLTGMPDPADGEKARYDTSAMARRFGWSPAFSLEDSIARVAEAMQQPELQAC